jgi:hypothetical protein
MIYKCQSGSKCTQTFATERGLHLHRLACDHYKRHQAAVFAKRKLQAEQRKKVVPKDWTRKGKGMDMDSASVSLSFKFTQYSRLIK